VKIQFLCDKTPTSTEITGIQFEYAYPENGRSSSGETLVTIYQLDYIHPEGGRHERTAKTLKMEATSYFDTAKSICHLDGTDFMIKADST